MEDLLPRLRLYARRHALFAPGEAVVVGVSGGPDSVCLLHLLRRLAPEAGLWLHVAHLHHGLRGADADADARFVAELAESWGLPASIGRTDVAALAAAPGVSIEEAARHARYAYLAEVAEAIGAATIAVGHNADDQAETVLMHFLRGSGVAGLRGMLPRTPLTGYRLKGAGFRAASHSTSGPEAAAGAADQDDSQSSTPPLTLVRPLLDVPRAEIEAYCAARGLTPRFDRSNEDTTIYRNRLRHELLPVLASYNPAIREVLVRTADVLTGDHALLRQALDEAWAAIALPDAPGQVRLDLAGWRRLPIGLQRATLREAVHRLRHSLRNINWEHIERATWLGREGGAGQSATLAAGLALEVGYDVLRIADEGAAWASEAAGMPQIDAAFPLAAPGETPIRDGWWVVVRRLAAATLPEDYRHNADPWTAWLDDEAVGAELLLRPREPGDRFQPAGLAGHAKVNEFMINAKVPRHARAGWPILTGRQGIAWLCGLRVDQRAVVRDDTRWAWEVRFVRTGW